MTRMLMKEKNILVTFFFFFNCMALYSLLVHSLCETHRFFPVVLIKGTIIHKNEHVKSFCLFEQTVTTHYKLTFSKFSFSSLISL